MCGCFEEDLKSVWWVIWVSLRERKMRFVVLHGVRVCIYWDGAFDGSEEEWATSACDRETSLAGRILHMADCESGCWLKGLFEYNRGKTAPEEGDISYRTKDTPLLYDIKSRNCLVNVDLLVFPHFIVTGFSLPVSLLRFLVTRMCAGPSRVEMVSHW